MNKKIFAFIHVPKTGGTSLWTSLCNAVKHKTNIDTYDSFHSMYSLLSRRYVSEINLISKKLLHFKKSDKEILLIHIHRDATGLHSILSGDMDVKYITMMRNPKKRILSAYRHYHTISNHPLKGDTFFVDMLFNNGYDNMFPSIFNLPLSSPLPENLLQDIILLSHNDYNNKLLSTKLLENLLDISIVPMRHEATVTTHFPLPEKSDTAFWNIISNRAESDFKYYNYLSGAIQKNILLTNVRNLLYFMQLG
jgi:hypothetical protein